MLLIASETIRSSAALNDVVREMSFTLSFFASPAKLVLDHVGMVVEIREGSIHLSQRQVKLAYSLI